MAIIPAPLPVLYQLDRLRRLIVSSISHSANIIIFAIAVLILGVGSSLYLVDYGFRLTTVRGGPWVMWTQSAGRDLDPYTRARLFKTGNLPINSSIAATWETRYDADGRRLHSSCEYLLESDPVDANWFSLSVFDDRGLLIPNVADRYSFNAQSLAYNPDGSFFVVLARDARPGNWLPVGGAGRLVLVLTILEPRQHAAEFAKRLPTIRRVACR